MKWLILTGMLAGMHGGGAASFSGVLAFGDSLSDRGNTVAVFGPVLNATDAYNSRFYDDGRWSNGPLWIENVNAALTGRPWLRNPGSPTSIGADFAWGGSTSGTGYTSGVLANLRTQVGSYQNNVFVGPLVDFSVGTKLISVWSGGNDVINAVQGNESFDPDALSSQMAANVSAAVEALYALGARFFIVPNLPDLGKKPNYRLQPFLAGAATNLVGLYNPKLRQAIYGLRERLSGATIYAFDAFDLLDAVIATPTAYGLVNATESAYVPNSSLLAGGFLRGDPADYLFWDTTHPTRAGHQLVANGVLGLIDLTAADRAAPRLRVIRRSVERKGARVKLRGRASDDQGVDQIEIRIGQDVEAVELRVNGRWSAKVRVPRGRTVLRVRAVDRTGKFSRERRQVIQRGRPRARG